LITAFVIHLKVGGVFIADTDLFQKDISRLLNCSIGDAYHQVKHLLKLFPVYFNDIGAEGELREVSSRIDDVAGRRDPLCHFLRKQCHVESNPLLITFIEGIGHFWATGEREPLRPYIPAALYKSLDIENREYRGLHRIFSELADSKDVRELFALELPVLHRRLEETSIGEAVDREKAELLFKLRKLIGAKYELDHDDLLERLAAFHHIAEGQVEALREALEEERDEAALEILLGVLERLKEMIVSEEQTEGVEDIYHKRHIAVGIPSMYGRYREEKFEAMGLSFRIESLANVLLERLVSQYTPDYVTRSTLQSVLNLLRLMLRGLRVDGCRGRGLATGISMLGQALLAEGISIDQYINIFQFISHSVEQVIRIRFIDAYDPVLGRLLRQMLARGVVQPDDGEDAKETTLKISEEFLRDLIAQSFGLQQLDNLVGNVLRALVQGRERLDRTTLNLLMTCDADRCYVPIDPQDSPQDSLVYLGNKGYNIRRLAQDGLPVPHGFILTTELFRCRAAILACDELRRESAEQIRRNITRLEGLTGARFGDPRRPLLLSVRSSAPISMPGILDTFLNVGINAEVAEGLALRSGSQWGAWDAYRCFLQFWGMGHGIDRELFDALMRDAKQQFGVAKKSHLPPDRMKIVALQYRDFLLDHGVEICEDPYEQIHACVDLVLDSWNSEKASIYRSTMQIAEEWGTAVIVQSMVYGNLNQRSGTGVSFTCDPRRASGEVHLYGDFIAQGQGEDVVSGLVETFPISEEQRLSESELRSRSLETDCPAIYEALERQARSLIHDHGMYHQEIEFTFESDDPSGLYILQTRDAVLSQVSTVSAFLPTEALEHAKVATGIGAGSGALSGRVAHTAEDIADLRRRFPEDPIILLRPDTVPDDIPLVLQVDGMLTALGGATSHAAVVAQRLGRSCVVGCRQLQVFKEKDRSELDGRAIATGDFISINGTDGSVYLGKHPSTMVPRQRLA
jgi:pyruvate,orthophosphate dikinase